MSSKLFHTIHTADLNTVSISSLDSLCCYLDDSELKLKSKIKSPTRLKEFIVGRYMAKTFIGQQLSRAPKDIQFAKNEHGKPFILDLDSPLYFNLTHSNDVLALALSNNGEVGIDIEAPFLRRKTDIHQIAKRFFSANEYNSILSHEGDKEQRIQFYDIWTAKEAVLKAVGTGLSNEMDSFDASALNDGQHTIHLGSGQYTLNYSKRYLDQDLSICGIDNTDPAYIVASACLGGSLPTQYRAFQID